MRVLAVNAGSSTLKLSLLTADGQLLAEQQVEFDAEPSGAGAVGADSSGAGAQALQSALAELETPDVVVHRVVHGGNEFTGPARLSTRVRERLAALSELAPLHQPGALGGIDLVGAALPDVPAYACFDTTFHSTLPEPAYTYALPPELRRDARRYGFHGLSHAYASRRARELLAAEAGTPLRTVVCHLGAGASLAAVVEGRSVDTTMGFTPLEGLVMASRSGDVDPGLLLWILRHHGVDVDQLDALLNHRSGLTGLADTGDMRELLRRRSTGDREATLGLEVYLHRLRAAIAGMTASLGGLDALVFTGGVGAGSAAVRAEAVRGLEFLGVGIDPDRNQRPGAGEADTDISAPGRAARCLVVVAREDLQMAAEVRPLLAAR